MEPEAPHRSFGEDHKVDENNPVKRIPDFVVFRQTAVKGLLAPVPRLVPATIIENKPATDSATVDEASSFMDVYQMHNSMKIKEQVAFAAFETKHQAFEQLRYFFRGLTKVRGGRALTHLRYRLLLRLVYGDLRSLEYRKTTTLEATRRRRSALYFC